MYNSVWMRFTWLRLCQFHKLYEKLKWLTDTNNQLQAGLTEK